MRFNDAPPETVASTVKPVSEVAPAFIPQPELTNAPEVAETMSGQQIRYDFKVIQNTSTAPLTDFYVRDIIPGNALRVDKVVTGSYNQALKYKLCTKPIRMITV